MDCLKKTLISIFFIFLSVSISAHEWMAPEKDAAVKNPVNANEQNLILGKSIYEDACVSCHGVDSTGLDPVDIGLKKRPTNLKKTLKSHSDGDLFWKIKAGRNEMPSFQEDIEDKEIWSVIHYIRSL